MIKETVRRTMGPLKLSIQRPWLALYHAYIFHMLERHLRLQGRRLYAPDPASLLYVAASSLPYHTSGYSTRTHEVIRALSQVGSKVHVLTRASYPWDRKDRERDAMNDKTVVDDVRYQHVGAPTNNRHFYQYCLKAARVVAGIAAQKRTAVIHASSNHVNALPALIAAKKLELWELSRVSRHPEFMDSQRYQMGLALEGLVARYACHVFVISEQLGRYVHEHFAVPEDRISMLPNCVDLQVFQLSSPDDMVPFTIAYAGSLIEYEGLDTLFRVVATLFEQGAGCKLNIAGDGEARQALEALVAQLGIGGNVNFFGKLTPESARKVVARSALVCIPRKSYEVCKIIPPIKLVEAMGIGNPVVVPDLPVFRDELGKEPAGLFFCSGDVNDLARVLKDALENPINMRELRLRARTYVEQNRTWAPHVCNVLRTIDRLTTERRGMLGC
jgi:glycosyltransferase involved in cell wall biosynthesis